MAGHARTKVGMIATMRGAAACIAVALCAPGCDKTGTRQSESAPAKRERERPSARPAAENSLARPMFVGRVAESTNSDRYTYVRMTADSGDRWVAMPETEAAVGDTIAVESGVLMTNIHSGALGRTFDRIYFSPGIPGVTGRGATRRAGRPACVLAGGTGGGAGAAPAGRTFSGQVVETLEANRYTYVLVASGTNRVWAAAPQFQVARGDKVAVPLDLPMRDFKSPTLDRSFDVLYMASEIAVVEKAVPSESP